MSNISFNTPLFIGGREVILVNDVAGNPSLESGIEHSYIVVSRAANEKPSIYAFQDEVENLRIEFPTLPIIGIWQLIFHNGLIDWTVDRYFVEVGVGIGPVIVRDTGQEYIDSAVSTDNMIGGFCPSISYADESEYETLRIDLERVNLPDEFILTNQEIKIEKNKNTKNSNIKSLFIFILIVIFASLASFASVYKNDIDKKNAKRIKDKLSAVNEKMTVYQKTRYPIIVDYRDRINKLTKIYLFDRDLSTPIYEEGKDNYQGLSAKQFDILTSTQVVIDPASIFPWATTEKTPIDRWLVRF
jgi:hypothetical protein